MALLNLSHLSVNFSGDPLFTDVTLQVEAGQKIGVIGQNGVGKTTLLKLIQGELEPHDGKVFLQRGATLARSAQEMHFAPEATVIDEVRAVFAEDFARARRLAKIEARLGEEADPDKLQRLLDDYERLQREHDAAGGYDIDRTIATVLSRLGLPESAWEQPVEQFSGGERNVLGLAKILLSKPDIMLLDEPSNHLDMDGLEWFIEFLRGCSAAVIMVSHNRHLLDACVDQIWELRRAKVHTWTGNYSDFQRQKDEALALQERQYKVQQRLIKRLEFQARRLRDMARAYDDPGQAKRAKAMLRRVEQMDEIDAPDRNENRFHARFQSAGRSGRIALSVKKLDFAYGERTIFDRAGLEIEFGDRVCLVGPNGSGKTTLFRLILEQASWENPDLRLGKSVKVGSYHQFHDEFAEDMSLLTWAHEVTRLPLQPASELLHRFLFTREDLERSIGTLSGGEKSRLQLARLVHEKVNFLLMDEPTNHLDIQACEQLEEMLQDFEGTLFIISHDRYFLDKLVDRVVELEDRKLIYNRTSFAEWWARRQEQRQEGKRRALELHSRKEAADKGKSASQQEREQRKAAQRQQRKLRTELRSLEQRIEKYEAEKEQLQTDLETAYQDGEDHAAAEALSQDFQSKSAELEKLYARWEEVGSQIEDG